MDGATDEDKPCRDADIYKAVSHFVSAFWKRLLCILLSKQSFKVTPFLPALFT